MNLVNVLLCKRHIFYPGRTAVSVIGGRIWVSRSRITMNIPNTSLVKTWEKSNNEEYPDTQFPRCPSGNVNPRFTRSNK